MKSKRIIHVKIRSRGNGIIPIDNKLNDYNNKLQSLNSINSVNQDSRNGSIPAIDNQKVVKLEKKTRSLVNMNNLHRHDSSETQSISTCDVGQSDDGNILTKKTIASKQRNSTSENNRKPKKKLKYCGAYCCSCSPLCLFLSLIAALLLAAAIAALIIAVNRPKEITTVETASIKATAITTTSSTIIFTTLTTTLSTVITTTTTTSTPLLTSSTTFSTSSTLSTSSTTSSTTSTTTSTTKTSSTTSSTLSTSSSTSSTSSSTSSATTSSTTSSTSSSTTKTSSTTSSTLSTSSSTSSTSSSTSSATTSSTTSSTSSSTTKTLSTISSTSSRSSSTTTTSSTSTTSRPILYITQAGDATMGLYNTKAGGSTGGSDGRYSPYSQTPDKAIDGLLTTKYLNYGTTGAMNVYTAQPGANTGFYVTPSISNTSVACGIRFVTADDYPERDPVTVTLEGTNGIALNSSIWTLLYNGSTGIGSVIAPNRSTYGILQTFSNAVAYRSYRLLITAQRATQDSVQYAEAHVMGYY